MKRFPQKELWFDEKELKTDLGKDNFIFVGSSCDMFAKQGVQDEWIKRVLCFCRTYPENTYLFQTKNPQRFFDFEDLLRLIPKKILATTIESNRTMEVPSKKAPIVDARAYWLGKIKFARRMVTIEPIVDFDLKEFVELIKEADPEFVNIGADSNSKRDFTEPSKEKILKLIEELNKFTKIKKKENLGRLLK
jgi:protein gp37